MPARALWSGSLTFGLVAIPVSIAPAVRGKRFAFHLLHDKDHARLQRSMYCPEHKKVIHPEHIMRGVEVGDDKYITVREDELESLEPERSQAIEISDFVDADSIPPLYYERAYYLAPGTAEKPYRLLAEALARKKMAGIAKFIMHGREYLVAVKSIEGALCLMILRFHDEVVPPDELPEVKADAADVKKAEKLMEEMSGPFHPEKIEDEYQDRMERLIAEKKKKKAIVEAPSAEDEETEEMPPEDLIAALEKSLAASREKRKRK